MVAGVAADAHIKDAVFLLFGPEARFHQLFIRRAVRSLAHRTEHAYQSLREHAVQAGDEIIRLDAHIEKSPDHVNDVVGVDGREDQVARERRLDGDLRGLRVAYLADHNLVRVVAQDGTKPAREGEPLLFVDGNLRDAVQLVLDRVFDGDALVFFVPDLVQGSVKRGRLAGAGGPGDEHHPVRLGDVATKLPDILVGEPDDVQVKIAERFVDLLFVKNTNDSILAVHGRHDRDAKVNVTSLVAHAKTPVLRHAALGDVQFRHDLDARDQRLVIGQIDRVNLLVERAVDAILDLHFRIARLDVNV